MKRLAFLALLAAAISYPVLAQSTKQRVVFQVSDNDPAKWNLALNNARNEMYGGVSYVQAGVTHLMKRQREGWAYIRP